MLKFPTLNFVYGRILSFVTGHSLFESNYIVNPLTPLGLMPLPIESRVSFEVEESAKGMKKIH